MRKNLVIHAWFCAAACFCPPGQAAEAGTWPRFRGPNGTGIAPDQSVPVRWTAQEGVLWKAALPGAGNSSPVVWGKRLFLQTATSDARQLLCLDVKDGRLLWKKTVPGAVTWKHPRNSFASSTPATDGQRVYALFWDGEKTLLAAYTADGKPVWQFDLGTFTSQHGPGTSPIVYGGKVFLANDQDGASELVALDSETGKLAWRAKRQAFRACYSTPLVLDCGKDKTELIVASSAGVTSYDPQSGRENWWWTWHFDGMALRTVASPVAGDGLIFASSGDGSGARHTVAIKTGGKGDVTKTHLAWERKRDFPYVPSLLLVEGLLFAVHDRGIASCRIARTGKNVWEERLGYAVTSSPVLVGGKIYVVSEKGDVFVFGATRKFKLLARNSVGESVFATPAVADNRLFIRGAKHLWCIGGPAARARK